MNLSARRGRNQQGFCFVSEDVTPGIYELEYHGELTYVEVRSSKKVPKGTIIIDSRISTNLGVTEENNISLEHVSSDIPTCNEIHLGVVSTRGIDNQKVAQAMSKRIDDFREYLDGLILFQGQELPISELGINLHILSMDLVDPTTNAAKISWDQLLKIHLASMDSSFCNLLIIVESAAATQIDDVESGDQKISRHEGILTSLQTIETQFAGFGHDALFSGIAFSDEVFPFISFDIQTGEEVDVSTLDSPSLIRAFREWIDSIASDTLTLPSNPGEALKQGLAKAQSLTSTNNLPTAVLLFSSGIYSAGKNPVKVTRTHGKNEDVAVFAISIGIDSVADIMEAIAKEGSGAFIHIDSIEKVDAIIGTIDRWLLSKR